MNINMSKLVNTLIMANLPFFLILPTTVEAAAGTAIKINIKKIRPSSTSHNNNKKRTKTCDSYSRTKLLRKAKKYQKHITKSSQDYKVSPHLITAIITVESCFRARVRSSAGAAGLMQLMPATARRFGVSKRYNSAHNIKAGTKYLRYLLKRYQGNVLLAAAAYNAGEGAVDKYNGVPPYKETKAYVRKVLNAYRKLSKNEKHEQATTAKIPKTQQVMRQQTVQQAKRSYTQRTRAWYINQYQRKQSSRSLNLTSNELHSASRLLRNEEMKTALNFRQFL